MRSVRVFLIGALAGVLLAGAVEAAPLDLERYGALSVARLRLAERTWRESGRAPSAAEEAALWGEFETTSDDFLAYRGAHREEVERWLGEHPELAGEIERLAAQIRAAIEAVE